MLYGAFDVIFQGLDWPMLGFEPAACCTDKQTKIKHNLKKTEAYLEYKVDNNPRVVENCNTCVILIPIGNYLNLILYFDDKTDKPDKNVWEVIMVYVTACSPDHDQN